MERFSTAALYIRVSTEEQAAEGQSVDAQIEILTQYCKLYQINIYEIYKDLGISGKDTKNRPGLIKMLQDAKLKKFNMVLVWKISRLSRSLKDLLSILDQLEQNDIVFTSYSEKFDTSSPVGKMTLQLLGSIAEFERNTIIDNVKLGLQEYAKKGGKTGTVLGYDQKNKQLVINLEEAELVKQIYKLYTVNHYSMSEIAEYLNKLGYKTKRSNSFNKDGVGVILSNPVYIGINRHKIGHKDEYNTTGNQQQIIDIQTWNAAQLLRESNKKKRAPKASETFLLSGKLRCPRCNSIMYGLTSNTSAKSYRYYRCKQCRDTCSTEKVDKAVLERLKGVLLEDRIIQDTIMLAHKKSSSNLASLGCEQLEKDQKKIQNLLDRYVLLLNHDELASSNLILNKIKELEAKYEKLEALKGESCMSPHKVSTEISSIDYMNYIDQLFVSNNMKEIKCIIDVSIAYITLSLDKSIEAIYFKFYAD